MYMKTILKQILAVSVLSITTIPAIAQHYFSDAQKSEWLKKAQENTPELFYTTIKPEIQVDIVGDKQSFQGYKAVNPRKAEGLYSESFKGKSGIVLDLGDHYTGYFTFRVEEFQSDSDAPIRLKFTFAEVPAELRIPFDPYKGTISRAWLQDADSKAVKPGSLYLYHYVIQAMVDTGMGQEAKEAVKNYWGGMVQKGADTFWEVYDPDNDFISPYQFAPINSYCHAWSCTPIYFIRKYPEIFQK